MIQDYSIRNEFSIYNAKQFINSILSEKMYVFVGKTTEWPDESDPPTPVSSEQSMIDAWDNMLVVKRIQQADFTQAVAKNIWQTGTTYIPWDSEDGLIMNKKFFVITSDNRVYKCLDAIPNTPSTVEPTDTGISPVRLSDGYTWKFMYDLSSQQLEKFNDNETIPVKYLTSDDSSLQWQVQTYAVPGTINRIEVLNGGSGYTTANIVIEGDGGNASATATIENGSIKYITITNQGSGYTWAKITIEGQSSVKATARPVLSPIKGHGWNPVEELFGMYVIASLTFDNDEDGKFLTDISFRQLGLIINPTLYNSSTVANLVGCYAQYLQLNVGSLSGGINDGEYLNNTTTGQERVAQVITTKSNKVYVNCLKGSISVNDLLQGEESGSTFEVMTKVNPIMSAYSGDTLYVENRSAIQKVENQSETYRLIVKF